MPAAEVGDKRQAAREVIDVLHDISVILNTKLTRQQLSYCVSLIENGVNPEALANVIKELRERYPEPQAEGDATGSSPARNGADEG